MSENREAQTSTGADLAMKHAAAEFAQLLALGSSGNSWRLGAIRTLQLKSFFFPLFPPCPLLGDVPIFVITAY